MKLVQNSSAVPVSREMDFENLSMHKMSGIQPHSRKMLFVRRQESCGRSSRRGRGTGMKVELDVTGSELVLLYLAKGNEDAGRIVLAAAREYAIRGKAGPRDEEGRKCYGDAV
jgi:hypothetical protein